ELYIGGDSLARGYLNRPGLTADTFIENPFDPDSQRRLYKTGDLVSYLDSGELAFVGRSDAQVKIRGFRIELGEIEHQLLQLSAVNSAVVVAWSESGDHEKRLVAYVTSETDNALVSLMREHLQAILPDHMVPAFFVVLEKLPLTPNGKIDRKALPAPDGSLSSIDYVAPTTKTETQLVQTWAKLLNLAADKLSTNANFFACGGHSLILVRLVSEVRSRFAVELSIKAVFETPQLSQMAALIDQANTSTRFTTTQSQIVPLERASDKASNQFSASFAQQRLWFIDQMDGASVQYNMPGAMSFNGVFDAVIVEQVLARIIERHEPLRTFFTNSDDGPQQIIRADFDFKLTTLDLTELDADAQQTAVEKAVRQDANASFNLSEDLMLRSTFIRLSANAGVLLLNMHHIASDGWSMTLLVNEFWAQYDAILTGAANPYQPLSVQYADYAQWQQTLFAKEAFVTQLDYWDKQLSGLPLIHDLPLDHIRPKTQGFDGGRVLFEVNQATVDGLKSIALSANATLFMVLHGAFSLLLSRHSNTNDIVVGVPVANRMQQALEPII
ncbi:MAG: AMP-binding protein, partial [Algicola sp.]|nr:AMP-binding protein [Algicola sp.]